MSTAVDPIGAVGTGFGAASFLVQVLQGCVAGFSLWRQADAIGSDALIFEVRLDMQSALLRAWARQWGVEKGENGKYFNDTKFNRYSAQTINAILTIYSLLDSLKDMDNEFPVLQTAAAHSSSAAACLENLSNVREPQPWGFTSSLDDWVKKMEDLRGQANLNQRLTWALKNGKASGTLDLVEKMINGLYLLLPPPDADPTLPVVLNQTLPSSNMPLLNTVQQQTPDNPLLRGLAQLRSATVQLELRATALDHVDVNRNKRDLKVTRSDDKHRRGFGTFRTDDALVEWKAVDSRRADAAKLGPIFRFLMEQRIKNVARLLMSDEKPEELRTLPCLGVVTKPGASDTEKLYGLVYKTPSKTCFSLLDLLAGSSDKFWLNDRYSAARVVAKAVLYLHLAGWLHKGIRGGNILFFEETGTGKIDYAKPYLVGFEYSRESSTDAQTEDVADDLEWNLYRHPDVQGVPQEPMDSFETSTSTSTRPPFSAKYDIYSLGVVLLEIALMKPAWTLYEKALRNLEYPSHSALAFRKWLLDHEVPRLGPVAGKAYYEAAKACIEGGFLVHTDKSLSENFYVEVIQKLESPHAE